MFGCIPESFFFRFMSSLSHSFNLSLKIGGKEADKWKSRKMCGDPRRKGDKGGVGRINFSMGK